MLYELNTKILINLNSFVPFLVKFTCFTEKKKKKNIDDGNSSSF